MNKFEIGDKFGRFKGEMKIVSRRVGYIQKIELQKKTVSFKK